MLTKTDINAIGTLIDEKLERKLESKFNTKLNPIHDDVRIIKKDVKKLKRDVNGVIKMSDRGLLDLQKRTRKIEVHLGFPEPRVI